MSKNNRNIMLIVVIIVIVLSIIWYSVSRSSTPTANLQNNNPQASLEVNPEAGLTTASTDTSDTALQNDTSAVDAQIQGLNNDSANVNQSVNSIQ